eukprot:COSAG05_NODE_1271_length_5315_cov_2.397738_6_plen_65_part_00
MKPREGPAAGPVIQYQRGSAGLWAFLLLQAGTMHNGVGASALSASYRRRSCARGYSSSHAARLL